MHGHLNVKGIHMCLGVCVFRCVCLRFYVYRQLCYLFKEMNVIYTHTRARKNTHTQPITLVFIHKDESCLSCSYFVNKIMFVFSSSHKPVNSIAGFKLLYKITLKLIIFFESSKPCP